MRGVLGSAAADATMISKPSSRGSGRAVVARRRSDLRRAALFLSFLTSASGVSRRDGGATRPAPTYGVVNAIIENEDDGHTLTAIPGIGEEGTPGFIGPRLSCSVVQLRLGQFGNSTMLGRERWNRPNGRGFKGQDGISSSRAATVPATDIPSSSTHLGFLLLAFLRP
ncbi:hypothetical protein MUK42_07547 [Musa troglodytarum]|uniref:Uncharacterized protein n=1 Tax=Musa troglodytarum TaxID=320322 RepID=A0A9E7I9B0_9LILI|nr:hypothetical protein MUK42_07547 [Musa troglodytarum]